jgi:hypothetical protein
MDPRERKQKGERKQIKEKQASLNQAEGNEFIFYLFSLRNQLGCMLCNFWVGPSLSSRSTSCCFLMNSSTSRWTSGGGSELQLVGVAIVLVSTFE